MTKKSENIYKRKDNRWEGRYLKGHNEYGKRQIGYVYGKSYREVKEKLTEAKEHLEAIPEEIRALPFSCICAQWLRQQHNTVKQSTYAKYVRLLDTHILTAFGTLPLSDFSPELIHQFLLEKLEAGRRDGCGGLSPKTVQDIYMILKAVIRYGELKYKTQLPKPQPYPFPKQEHTILVLSLNEQMRLEHSMRLEPYNLRKLGILLCLYSGLRIGEICALRWTVSTFPRHCSVFKIQSKIPRSALSLLKVRQKQFHLSVTSLLRIIFSVSFPHLNLYIIKMYIF